MYGSNYNGQAYYGQGPAVGTTFILFSVSATVTATASIAFQLLINKTVSTSVTATASILRTIGRSLEASVTSTADISFLLVEGINIRRATAKFLNNYRTTNPLDGSNSTKQLNLVKTTRIITTDE